MISDYSSTCIKRELWKRMNAAQKRSEEEYQSGHERPHIYYDALAKAYTEALSIVDYWETASGKACAKENKEKEGS